MDALTAKAHVGEMINTRECDISWGAIGTPQNVATAVISEVNGSYERPPVDQNIPKGGPEYAAIVPYRLWAEPLVRQAVRHYWILKSVSRGGMGLWSGWLRRRRLLKTDSEPQIRKEPHIR